MNTSSQADVFVVEDDAKIARLLLDYLRAEGLPARWVANGLEAVAELERTKASLVLLDLTLPGLDGIGVYRQVCTFSDVPIIMLTARVDELDRLLGLDTGADDYVCKPFSPREVMARVKAQLRRAAGGLMTAPPLWRIDDERLSICWRERRLSLTALEFRIVRRMLQHPAGCIHVASYWTAYTATSATSAIAP